VAASARPGRRHPEQRERQQCLAGAGTLVNSPAIDASAGTLTISGVIGGNTDLFAPASPPASSS